MSIGNTKDNGNKGNNFPYQLASLQLLDQILTAISSSSSIDYELRTTSYKAIANGAGYSTGDFINRIDCINPATGLITSTIWFNETTGATIAAPPIGDLTPYIPPSAVTVNNLPVSLGQATMANSLAVVIASDQSSVPVTLPSTGRTPSLTRATGAGTVAAGAYSVSVYNAGTANATWLGSTLKPGEQLSYTAPVNDTLGAFAYTASVTAELVITTIV